MAITQKITTAAAAVLNHKQAKELKQRFDKLSERDRLALKILGVFVALWLVALIVFVPANHFSSTQAKHYQEAKSLLTWMRANEMVARQIASSPLEGGATNGQTLLNIINVAAQNRAIAVKRLEPEGDRNISVWLEKAAYEQVILWLFDLQEQHRVNIKQITIDKQPEAGYVNVHILFGG